MEIIIIEDKIIKIIIIILSRDFLIITVITINHKIIMDNNKIRIQIIKEIKIRFMEIIIIQIFLIRFLEIIKISNNNIRIIRMVSLIILVKIIINKTIQAIISSIIITRINKCNKDNNFLGTIISNLKMVFLEINKHQILCLIIIIKLIIIKLIIIKLIIILFLITIRQGIIASLIRIII